MSKNYTIETGSSGFLSDDMTGIRIVSDSRYMSKNYTIGYGFIFN